MSGVLLPGFAARFIDMGDVVLHVRMGGAGPPLLLLHGYPETHATWHRMAPKLARSFTVIAPDLRGYGRSSCPPSDASHCAYSKRAMAADMARLMGSLGFDRFAVIGHDRGARVAYRLAHSHAGLVDRLVVVDIMTTWDQWQPAQQATRSRIFHWAFLAQPAPIPETLIGADPHDWVDGCFRRGTRTRSTDDIDPRALAAYRCHLSDPDRIHVSCEDFRAGAGCDIADDEADRSTGRRIGCPSLVLWGTHGSLASLPDPLALWRPWCVCVVGRAVAGGH